MANGHALAAVWTYTPRTVQVLVDLIQERRREDLFSLSVAVRHTQGTDAKVFREFLNSLQKDE